MNYDLKNEFKLTNDGDNWGNVMEWLFAISDYLTFETDECVPDAWQFKPSPFGADKESYVFQALKSMALPSDEVLQFGEVLFRVKEILERKGQSY
tara:strand:- start:43 stop:327 length:285 start_codon:yes stop_codon:yes gene_type:complete